MTNDARNRYMAQLTPSPRTCAGFSSDPHRRAIKRYRRQRLNRRLDGYWFASKGRSSLSRRSLPPSKLRRISVSASAIYRQLPGGHTETIEVTDIPVSVFGVTACRAPA
jgi:hypothetical protein